MFRTNHQGSHSSRCNITELLWLGRAASFAITGLKNACTCVQCACVYNKYVSQTFLEENNDIVSWDLRHRRFLSYLEHSISWFKDPVVFWTELLMCWITYKQKQNITITSSCQWLLRMLCCTSSL